MELYPLLNSWFMVGWLLGAGCLLRIGGMVADKFVDSLRLLKMHLQKKKP